MGQVNTKKKKILILDTGKEWGGGTVSLLELLKRIDREQYEFSALFYTNYRKGNGSDIRSALEDLGVEFIHVEIKKRFVAKVMKEAIRGILWPLPSVRKKFIAFHDLSERIEPAGRAIASVLEEGEFDMIYLNNQPSSNMEGMLAAGFAGTLCVQHSRVDVRLKPDEAQEVNRVVDHVICVSHGVMDSLVNAGVLAERCRVVHNGIDAKLSPRRGAEEIRAELGMKDGEMLIGTVGSLIKRKRVHIFLEAISKLKKNGQKIKGLVVGAGPEEAALKERTRELGISELVTFTGFSDTALSYINAMDVFLLTSEAEGLPRVILEAMLMEKPVVAANVTGPAELILENKTGFLVDGDSPDGFTKKVSALLQSSDKRARMGSAGKKRVIEKFSIEGYVEGVEKSFKEVFDK